MDSLFFIACVAGLCGALAYLLARLRFDAGSAAVLFSALAFYCFHLLHAEWFQYANDASRHLDYIRYIAERHAIPPPGEGAAFRHPPYYYLLAAGMFQPGGIPGVRALSMAFFMVFLLFSALTFRRVLRGPSYYLALALLAFWPTALTMGSRITCDMPLFACMAGAVYAMMRWQEAFEPRWLAGALFAVALGVLTKNAMIAWLPIIAAPAFYHAARGRYPWRSLFTREVLLALLVLAFNLLVTFSRTWISRYVPSLADENIPIFAPGSCFPCTLLMGFSLHEFFAHTVADIVSQDMPFLFWNFFLRTMVLDQFLWRSDILSLTLCMLLFAILFLTAVALPALYRREPRLMALLLWLIVAQLAVMFAMLTLVPTISYANVRYAYTIIPIVILLYAKAFAWHMARGRRLLAAFYAVLALALGVASTGLVLLEHLG